MTLALGAIVLLAFSNSLRNTGFALDNKFILMEDPRLRKASLENLRLIFHEDYWWPKAVSGLYRPLTTLSYMFNYAILGNGTHAAGYHWFNFLLHWLDAVLVYFMALVLIEQFWPAVFLGALFATHPIVTESVTNIIGRADLFATAAIVGGLLSYVKSTTKDRWGKLPWLLVLMTITALGVFFKESAVIVLAVMVLYDFTYRLRRLRANWLANLLANFWQFFITGYVAVLPPLVAVAWVRTWLFGQMRPPEFPFVDNPLVSVAAERAGHYYNSPFYNSLHNWLVCTLTAIKVIGEYLWLLLWPQKLCCDYSYDQVPMVDLNFARLEDWKAILALLVVLAAIAAAVRQYRRNKAVFFFGMFFFLTLLPTSNLIIVTGSIMAERFLYLPSIGFAACVVIAVFALCARLIPRLHFSARAQTMTPQAAACGALSVLVLACGTRAFVRNFDWDDDIALWTADVKVCPDSFKTHKSLAYALYERYIARNSTDIADLDRATEEAVKARAVMEAKPLPPLYRASIVYLHLGAYYRLKGEYIAAHAVPPGTVPPDALPWYRKSVEALTDGISADHAFRDETRRKELARGRRPDQIPDVGNAEIYVNLGQSYVRLGQYQDALAAYQYMRHLSPTDPNAYISIAYVYMLSNKPEETAISLLQTLILDANRQDAVRSLVDLYRQAGQGDCAIIPGSGRDQTLLNADCPLVHRQMCAAYFGLVQVSLDAKQARIAQELTQAALQKYHCASEPFQKLLPDSTTSTHSNK